VSQGTALRADPREIPRAALGLCGALVAIGVLAFLGGLASDPATTWRAFHVNYLFYAGLSQGGLVLSAALVIAGARWAGPIRHVAEALAAWVPVSLVLFLLSFVGSEHIYATWVHGAPPPKEHWLTRGRLYAFDLAILGVLTFVTLRYLRLSFRPSLHGAAEHAPAARTWFERWTRGWRGDEVERADSARRLRTLAPIVALLYAFGYGFLGVDQVMSLTPTFYSTMFPWYFAWGGFLSAVAATALASVLLRRSPGWAEQVTRPRMHDLGKMVFAFSIFWMYLFFAQYIVIWYGNLPEETQFFQLRLGSQFLQDTWELTVWSRFAEPYVPLSLTAWAGCWVVPFWMLLGQTPKRTPWILGPVALVVLVGFWLERNALVWPSLVPGDGGAWMGPIQLGLAAGFLGAFALVFLAFSRVFPSLPLPQRH
jgi:hypothetical protein